MAKSPIRWTCQQVRCYSIIDIWLDVLEMCREGFGGLVFTSFAYPTVYVDGNFPNHVTSKSPCPPQLLWNIDAESRDFLPSHATGMLQRCCFRQGHLIHHPYVGRSQPKWVRWVEQLEGLQEFAGSFSDLEKCRNYVNAVVPKHQGVLISIV